MFHRFVQHSGRVYLSTIVIGELYTWAYSRATDARLKLLEELMSNAPLLAFELDSAKEFGRIRAGLLSNGITVRSPDLMIAAVALTYDLTLVTHNVRDFRNIPALRIEDWLAT